MTGPCFNIFEVPASIDAIAASHDEVIVESSGILWAYASNVLLQTKNAPLAAKRILTLQSECWGADSFGKIMAVGDDCARIFEHGETETLGISLEGPVDQLVISVDRTKAIMNIGVAKDPDIEVNKFVEIDQSRRLVEYDLEVLGNTEISAISTGYAILESDAARIWYAGRGRVAELPLQAQSARLLRASPASGQLLLLSNDGFGAESISIGKPDRGSWVWETLWRPKDSEVADIYWQNAQDTVAIALFDDNNARLALVRKDGSISFEQSLPSNWVTEDMTVSPDGGTIYASYENLLAVWHLSVT